MIEDYKNAAWYSNLSVDMQSRGLTDDAFLDGRLQLYQPKLGYRAAMDPVLLAAAAPALTGKRILDLGSGVGTAGFCYLRRCPSNQLVAVEKQADLAHLAQANAQRNGFSSDFKIMTGDIKDRFDDYYHSNSFDLVITNPPYLEEQRTLSSQDKIRQQANVEGEISLKNWIDIGLKKLRQKGTFVIVQRADRTDEIVAALQGRLGEICIIPLWPKQGENARRVVIRGRKAVKGGTILHPGIILHDHNRRYSFAAEDILRFGTAID